MKFRLLILTILIALSLKDETLSVALTLSTMFISGYAIIERFFSEIDDFIRLSLYILLSVIISTHLVYYLSLILGYSLLTIRISTIVLILPVLFVRKPVITKSMIYGAVTYLILFFFAFSTLYHSLWYEKEDYVVLSGSNWQDTPYHYEIIESINSGNFPPEDPSFSGFPLRYHYFVDFHAAIMEKSFGYYPRILLFLNSALFPLFFFAVFYLTMTVTESWRSAVYSGIISVFGWGFNYVWLFSSILSGEYDPKKSYVMDYAGTFNLAPLLDNLLQQRPLLTGLPGFAMAVTLFIRGIQLKDRKYILFSGILKGLLFPFHVLATFCIFLFVLIYLLESAVQERPFSVQQLKERFTELFRISYPFTVSTIFFLPFIDFLSNGELGNPWFWEFGSMEKIFANLGVPFILAIVAPFMRVKNWRLLSLWMISALSFIFLPSITPNVWDMYKFFLFAWIPISILSSQSLASFRGKAGIAVPVLLVLSTLSTVPVVLWNQTDYGAASIEELQTGLWIRNNTPEKSVFLTWPSLHSPPTMIGGRLRILGYTNWPYGHGVPFDQIWERFEDIKAAYSNRSELDRVIDRYEIDYVYYGLDERINFKNSYEVLISSDRLVPVFRMGGNVVFKVVR